MTNGTMSNDQWHNDQWRNDQWHNDRWCDDRRPILTRWRKCRLPPSCLPFASRLLVVYLSLAFCQPFATYFCA
ncbi:MAG: hypothetical protein ACO2PK_04255 [Armatimonadota bacterium]